MIALAALLLFASAEELYKRGVDLFQNGKADAAAASLTEAARLAPGNAQIWKVLGVVYASSADYERAREPFEKACSLAPRLEDACYFHGRNLYALNRFVPALEALEKALARDRNAPKIHLGVAQTHEALGNAEQAERAFRTAIRESEKLPANARGNPEFDPRVHYALFLFRQGKQAEALPFAQAAVASAPESARARYELGRILYHLDKLGEAEAELKKAVELGFGPPAELMLGKALVRLGREAEAQRYLRPPPE
jgi:tetratricopeptide (TPR) repeat protein